MEICALIPVYNEAPRIGKVVKGCLKHLRSVCVVDDGSTDGSAEAAQKAGAVVLRHPINLGKGAALRTGFARILRERKFDGIAILDGDGQHDWDEIPKLIFYLQNGAYDIVIGNRMGNLRPMPFRRKATNYLSSVILSALTGQRIADSQCGFRLLRTSVLEDLSLRTTKFDTESEILLEASQRGFKIGNMPIATIYEVEKSYVRPVLDTLRFLRVAVNSLFRGGARPRKVKRARRLKC